MTKVHPLVELGPSRVFASFRPAVPSAAFDFPRFLVPTTASPERAPREADRPDPPRFRSQAFSASQRFPSKLDVRGLVSCHSRSWDPPSELVPHEDHVPLSRPLAPLQLSTGVLKRAVSHRSSLVSPTSTLSRGCLDPPATMDSLLACSRARFPVVLGSKQRTRLVPPASPASKLFSPRETVPAALGCPAVAGRFSCSCPFEAFSSHTSGSLPGRI